MSPESLDASECGHTDEEAVHDGGSLRVALFPSQFHPHFGGVEELVRQQAHQLVRLGHRVLLVTNRWPKTLPAREFFEGLDVRRYLFRCPGGSWRQTAGAWLWGPSTLRKICRDLREFGADLIHVQCVSTNAVYAARVKHRLNLPLVVTLQGEFTMDARRVFERPETRAGVPPILGAADVITGCSAKTLADGEALAGAPFGNRARVIFNGASIEDFAQAEPYRHPRPYVLGIGRLVPQKGFDLLIEAMALIGPATFDLLIAGDGPERQSLELLARDKGLADRVHFLGRSERPRVVSLFAGSSLFALPSRADEGLPVVCAEALAAGRPTVAARVGGVPEVVLDGETGLIVPRENAAALAEAISRLMTDADLRHQFGNAARVRSRLFGWPFITRQYIETYRAALRGGR